MQHHPLQDEKSSPVNSRPWLRPPRLPCSLPFNYVEAQNLQLAVNRGLNRLFAGDSESVFNSQNLERENKRSQN